MRHTPFAVGILITLLLLLPVGSVAFKGSIPTLSDQEIAAAIKQRLAMDGRIDATGIKVKVNKGNVILMGTVNTLIERALAEHLVTSMYGVRSVTNELVVHPAFTPDAAIKQAVEEELKSTPALQKEKIDVSVKDGVVTLRGAVEKPWQARAAKEAAETVSGVKDVVNLIKVVGKPRPDKEIEKDVLFYLQSSSLVDLDKVDFNVQNGVVKLRGAIDNLAHKFVIANEIEKIHGVKAVDVFDLTVSPRGSSANGPKSK